MTLKYVSLPLFDDYEYSYTIALQGSTYAISVKYNERMKQWFIDLDVDETVSVFKGVGLVPTYPIALDYAIYPLTGYFWLENIPDINTEQYKQYPDKLRQYYRFFYIYNE